jgi:hypothetical protein
MYKDLEEECRGLFENITALTWRMEEKLCFEPNSGRMQVNTTLLG